MKLTTRGRYALRAMLYLASNAVDTPLPLSQISQCGLPRDYLEQLMASLRRDGLVQSVRGKEGGYHLARPAAEINLLQVLAAVEGPLRVDVCEPSELTCDDLAQCGLRSAWSKLTDEIHQVLSSYTLDQISSPIPKHFLQEGDPT